MRSAAASEAGVQAPLPLCKAECEGFEGDFVAEGSARDRTAAPQRSAHLFAGAVSAVVWTANPGRRRRGCAAVRCLLRSEAAPARRQKGRCVWTQQGCELYAS
jgi:hypothetical protein